MLHGQNQKMVQVKQVKVTIETTLNSVKGGIEETRGEAEDADDLVDQHTLMENIWMRRFDELATLVEAGQADGAAVADIRGRSFTSEH